jgi:ribosomal protein S27AE
MGEVKVCPTCGCINSALSIFCENCGVDISSEKVQDDTNIEIRDIKKCPNCGYSNDKDAVVCEKCGNPLDNVKPKRFIDVHKKEEKINDKKENISNTLQITLREGEELVLITESGDTIKIPPNYRVTLGREGDIRPEIFMPYLTVSRRHLIVEYKDGNWYITDISKTNFTYLNGNPIEKNKAYPIKKGDIISLSTKFKLKVM